jgi:ABC-type branched-subunit amino acid transport system ATPase component
METTTLINKTADVQTATLECHNLVKTFGGVCAIDNLSVVFEAGKITALIGSNGAGKTTLFHLLSGALHPDTGQIFYSQQRIDHLPSWRNARCGIGRLFQDVRVFDKLSVLDNVLVAFSRQHGENPIKCLFRRPQISRQERDNVTKAQDWLDYVGLGEFITKNGEDLSYGQQKLLALARLLAAEVEVFLLDEPTAGVHPERISMLLNLTQRLADEGKTVIVIEHNMSVVTQLADWVYFMDRGKIVTSGRPDVVLQDRQVRSAYLGL